MAHIIQELFAKIAHIQEELKELKNVKCENEQLKKDLVSLQEKIVSIVNDNIKNKKALEQVLNLKLESFINNKFIQFDKQINSSIFDIDSRIFSIDSRIFAIDSKIFAIDSRIDSIIQEQEQEQVQEQEKEQEKEKEQEQEQEQEKEKEQVQEQVEPVQVLEKKKSKNPKIKNVLNID